MTNPLHQGTAWTGLRDEDLGSMVVHIDRDRRRLVLTATGTCERELRDNYGSPDIEDWADVVDQIGHTFPDEPGLWRWTGHIQWDDRGGVPDYDPRCTAVGTWERLPTAALWSLRMGRT